MACRALKQPEISILREPFYVAQADFRLGNAPYEVTMTSIMTNFSVAGIPRTVPSIKSKEVLASQSSNVSLSCWIGFDNNCPQKLFWTFNDKPVSGIKYNVELKDTHARCKKELTLSIFNVTESDEGKYSCHWHCNQDRTKAVISLSVFTQKG